MAVFKATTPKNFITSRKPKTPLMEMDFTTPKFTTPKRLLQGTPLTNTPECFNNVHMETPKSIQKRNNSKEKFDEISNLTVAVRIRPMNSRELAIVGAENVVKVKGKELTIRSNSIGNSGINIDHIFQYDHIFWSCDNSNPLYSNQENVFIKIGKPLLNSAFCGYNACLFAYGQTGSGKSFSMMGKNNNCDIIDIDSIENSGIIPRFCRDLFDRINKWNGDYSIEVSYFEIYNEKIHDLLAFNQGNSANKIPLKVREHPEWGPYVVDLSVHSVKNYQELREWLLIGNKNRATAATNMNEKSSRSHSIFTIELCLCDENNSDNNTTRRSKVSLVDLAGSERLNSGTSGHNSDEKIRQGVSINKSLLTLGKVISALADQKKNQFVPYRESVLTWLLKESLGGNSLTCMLATITPSNTNLEETLATLRYACQARTIINRARINESPHDRLIRELKSEVQRLNALKMEYEKHSINSSSSSLNYSNNNNNISNGKDEMDELKLKLLETENKLKLAENNWKKRFRENDENKLKKLYESEKRREELESKFRIFNNLNNDINLSPFKTNFLEEVEAVLINDNDNDGDNKENDIIENVLNYCYKNDLTCTFTLNTFTIYDLSKNRQTLLKLNDINDDDINKALKNVKWSIMEKKKLNKNEILENFQQIYKALNNLQPNQQDNNLNLLFAKVNKSLQSFEAALLNNCNQKTVTFNL